MTRSHNARTAAASSGETLRQGALALAFVLACGASAGRAEAAENGGLLWKDRAEKSRTETANETNTVPVILSTVAGSVLGIEIAVVAVGPFLGPAVSWWTLGTAGAVAGGFGGAVAGDMFFNRKPSKGGPEASPEPANAR